MLYLALLLTLSIASPAAAASYDLPKRKSGLWEIKMSSAQMKGMQAMQQCVDQKTDNFMRAVLSDSMNQRCLDFTAFLAARSPDRISHQLA